MIVQGSDLADGSLVLVIDSKRGLSSGEHNWDELLVRMNQVLFPDLRFGRNLKVLQS